MSASSDLIVALSTPPSSAALALLRMSGPGTHALAEKLCGNKLKIQRATYVSLLDAEGRVIDNGVATIWQKPRSYTGEEMLEVSCHGNMLIVDQLIRRCIELGARIARPGEFTQRAFLNGKMDLTQAEAVMDLISAQTDRALQAAQRIEQGELSRLLLIERDLLITLLAHLEAYIDFPEEDIEPQVGASFIQEMAQILSRLEALRQTASEGKRLREGVRVVLAGKPNAGKSSLLNALLKKERAIVSSRPGTTRDTIEEAILLEGILVRLIDTAGLRASEDEVERLGIARTEEAIAEADLILELIDGAYVASNETLDSEPFSLPSHPPKIRCITKADLPHVASAQTTLLKISAHTQEGLNALKEAIVRALKLAESHGSQEVIVMNLRHQMLLERTQQALAAAYQLCTEKAPPELISIELQHTLHTLGEIVGQVTHEDMLDKLFHSFCIGK